MLTVALMESETAGNIGAIARAMRNFGADKLILLSPKADPLSKEAQDRAKYAKDLLSKAAILSPDEFFKNKKKHGLIIGTSAKPGSSYNMKRNPLTPRQLAEQLVLLAPKANVTLLLGREGIGLINEEIEQCDVLVTIPASPRYGVLNVSAAATVILAEIFAARAAHKESEHTLSYVVPPSAREREQLIALAYQTIDSLNFYTPQKYQTQKIVWKKLFGKVVLSRREAFALMGFFRKALERAPPHKPK